MSRLAAWTVAVTIATSTWASAADDQNAAADAVGAPTTPLQWHADRANPYSRLFQPREPRALPLPDTPGGRRDTEPMVKCGMTLIPADPAIDPGMATPPRASHVRPTIRAVEPPICR